MKKWPVRLAVLLDLFFASARGSRRLEKETCNVKAFDFSRIRAACERMNLSRFILSEDWRPILANEMVKLINESKIYRRGADGVFKPFAWNPWPAPSSNMYGDFRFPDEERFPLHRVERGADGKIILKDGLQLWSPNDLHLGMTTTFNAANAAKDAVESWAGRNLAWGQNGLLEIETQAFIDLNAFYSPSSRMLFFGVVPYRLTGQTDIRIFETATLWDIAAHESGHALQATLKPNADHLDQGYRTWSESFGDQTVMWTSLRDRDRVFKLLSETNGDLNQSNALTRIGEVYALLVGKGAGLRDAFHSHSSNQSIRAIRAIPPDAPPGANHRPRSTHARAAKASMLTWKSIRLTTQGASATRS